MALETYEVQLHGGIVGQPVYNILHFQLDELAIDNPVLAARALLDELGDGTGAGEYTKLFLDCLPENYFLLSTRARRITSGGGPTVTKTFPIIPGNRTGDSDVSGIGPVGLYHAPGAGVENWKTGKIFFPGVSTVDIANNSFTDSLKTAILAFLDLAQTVLALDGGRTAQQKIWSRIATLAIEILAQSISGKVGTQRRRYLPL